MTRPALPPWPSPCPPCHCLQLEGENARLHRQNRIYEKVLAVRDAMLQTFTSLHPTAAEQLQQQQAQQQQQMHQQQQAAAAAAAAAVTPTSSAAQGLVKALDELPSEHEMDAAAAFDAAADADAVPASQQLQPPQQQQLGMQPDQPLPQSLLAEQHRSGSAAQLDGSALQKVENIPPAHDLAIREMVAAMQQPEELVSGLRRGWGAGWGGRGGTPACPPACVPDC